MLGLRGRPDEFPPVLEQQLLFDLMRVITLDSVVTVKPLISSGSPTSVTSWPQSSSPAGRISRQTRANPREPTSGANYPRASSRDLVYPGEPPDWWLRTNRRSLSLSRSAPGTLTPQTADNARYVKLME